MKKFSKTKINICKPQNDLIFVNSFRIHSSIYVEKLTDALNSSSVIEILREDKYVLQQFKIAAKKIHLRLFFAIKDENLYIKPVQASDEEKRLILYLREPRTLVALQSYKLELHLINTLEKFKKDGIVHFKNDKWNLTEKGFTLII